MLQDGKSPEHVQNFETVQSVATEQPELRIAETLSELHHARQLIDNLNALLEKSEWTAAEKYSTITRKLEYTQRVYTLRAC